MAGEIKSYRDLIVWQKAVSLVEKVYFLTKTFPREETYGMISQIQRAGVSVPANIAEGYARNSRKEYLQFLGIARGSLSELETLIIISGRVGHLQSSVAEDFLLNCSEVGKLLGGLSRSLSYEHR